MHAAAPPADASAPRPSPTPQARRQKPPAPRAAPPRRRRATSVTGKVVFKGKRTEPEQIDMSGVKECAMQHPDGAFAERLVVNGNGTLKNVARQRHRRPARGQKFPVPATPAKLDQKGCQYYPHVVAVMTGQPLVDHQQRHVPAQRPRAVQRQPRLQLRPAQRRPRAAGRPDEDARACSR